MARRRCGKSINGWLAVDTFDDKGRPKEHPTLETVKLSPGNCSGIRDARSGATLDEAFVSRAPRASTRATSAPRRAYAAAFAKARAAPHPHSRSILAQCLSAASDVCLAHKPPHLSESIKSALATPAVVGSGLAVGGRSHRRVVLIRVGPARVCHWLHVAGQRTCGVEYSL